LLIRVSSVKCKLSI